MKENISLHLKHVQCKCGFKEQLRDPNENVKGEKFTNTSLMEMHSPRKRDSGGIHLTGRRAFTKKGRKLLEINVMNKQ